MDSQEIYEKVQALVQKEISVAMAKNEDRQRFTLVDIPSHSHTGVDSNKVDFANISAKKLYLPVILENTTPATAASYGVFFIAPFSCYLSSVRLAFQVTSTSGTLDIEKLTGTQALDAGIPMLYTPILMSGTANTVVKGRLSDTPSSLQLLAGDRIALKDAGTLTNLVGLCVIIELTLT